MTEKNNTLLSHCKRCKEPIRILIRERKVIERTSMEIVATTDEGITCIENQLDYGTVEEASHVIPTHTQWVCEYCGGMVTEDVEEATQILSKTVTDLDLLKLNTYTLDVLRELKDRGYMIGRPQDGWELISSSYGNVCNECGQTGMANRVPSKDSLQERINMGKPYPRGGYHCGVCEGKINEGCLDDPFHSCDGDCDHCEANGTLHGQAAIDAEKNPRREGQFNVGEIMCFKGRHPHPTLGDRHDNILLPNGSLAEMRNRLEEKGVLALMPLYYDGKTLVAVPEERKDVIHDVLVGFTYTTWQVVLDNLPEYQRGVESVKGILKMELKAYNRHLTGDVM